MQIFIITVVVALVVWISYSYFSSNVEQLKYSVIEKRRNYEVRQYAKYIEASVVTDGEGSQALNNGFRILASYIFGNNLGNQKVAMTAPVLSENKIVTGDGEKVAMTAPVIANYENGKTKVVFSMPSKYTLSDLPKTSDTRISFKEIPEKTIAAYRFSGYFTNQRIKEKKKAFLEILKQDNVKVLGEPVFAGYNAPGTFPLMIRNEILVDIEK
jgi:hypothetical protein